MFDDRRIASRFAEEAKNLFIFNIASTNCGAPKFSYSSGKVDVLFEGKTDLA